MKQSARQFRAPHPKRGSQAAISGLVFLMGAMIAPPPIQAGEYVLNRVETEDGEVYESTSTPDTRPWTGSQPNSADATKFYIPSSTNYTVSVRSKGKVRAVFVWQPAGENDTPPQDDTLCVKVSPTTYVSATVGYGQPAGTLSNLTVNNGFGDAPVNQGYGNSSHYVSQGHHLVQVKTNGQTELKTPFITMHGETTLSGTTGSGSGSATAGAYHTYSAARDDRAVWIESPTIEDSYHKSQDILPPNPTVAPEKNNRNPDLSISLDSSIQWEEESGKWTASPLILGKASNFNWPIRTWSYAGDGQPSPSTLALLSENHDWFYLLLDFGSDPALANPFPSSPFSKSGVLNLKVTDNDGAQGENWMSIKWHLPVENWRELTEEQGAPGETYVEYPLGCDPSDGAEPLQSVTGTIQPVPWIASGVYGVSGVAINTAGTAGGIVIGAKVGAALGAETGPGIVATSAVGAILGYLSVQLLPATPQPTLTGPQQSTLDKWNAAVIYTLAHPTDAQMYPAPNASWTEAEKDLLYNGSKMTLYYRAWTKNHLFYGDKYGVHGYEGRAWQNLEILSRDEVIPFFDYSTEPSNP